MKQTELAKNLSVVWHPHPVTPYAGREVMLIAAEGYTIRDLLLNAQVDQYQEIVVYVDDKLITVEEWDTLRPTEGQLVNVQAVVSGGGGQGSNPLQIVMMVAIVALSIATAGGALAPLLGTGFAAGTVGAAIAGAVISIAGSLIMGALFRPDGLSASATYEQPSPTYSLTGGSNRARPYESMPVVMGTHRAFADYSSRPYTEYRGDDQYLYQIFNWGLGNLNISDYRIGTTPLTSYTDYELFAADGNGVLSQFPGNVDSIAGAQLTFDNGFITRTTSTNTYRIGIDIEAILFEAYKDGRLITASVDIEVQYKASSSGDWIAAPTDNYYFPTLAPTGAGTFSISGWTQKPQRGVIYIDVASGQYDVRVRRITPESTDSKITKNVNFGTLRSYQADTSTYKGQNRLGLVIRASEQLNGTVQQLSANISAQATYWDGSAWVTGATSNPAHWFMHFARGVYNSDGKLMYGVGLTASQLDLPSLHYWAQFCAAEGLTFNAIVDGNQTAADVLNAIGRCGLGSPTWASGKLGAVWDYRNSSPVASFGMSNIIRDTFDVSYINENLAEEVIVRFRNPDKDWEADEVRVLAPNITNPLRTSSIDLFGCTSETMAGKFANYLAAQQYYRRRRISWESDFEGFVCQRGDVVVLSHDLTQWGYSGRIVSVSGLTITLDRTVPRSGFPEYLMLTRPDGTMTTYTTTSESGEYNTVTLTIFPSLQAGYDLMDHRWSFSPLATPGKKVKIISIDPMSESRLRIVATDEFTEFYNAWNGSFIAPPDLTLLPKQPVTVENLVIQKRTAIVNGYVTNRISIFWSVGGGTLYTRVKVYFDGNLIGEQAQNLTGYYETDVPGEGVVYVEVTPYGLTGAGTTVTASLGINEIDLPLPPEEVTLEVGENGKSATFTWEEVFGIQSYVVEIFANGLVRRTLNIGNSRSYTYTLEDAIADGGPFRQYEFRVYSVSTTGQSATYASAQFNNPQIGALFNVSLSPFPLSLLLRYTIPGESDFAGVQVWISTNTSFTPSADTLVYDGTSDYISIESDANDVPLAKNTTYFLYIAAYDSYGKDNLTLSGKLNGMITSIDWDLIDAEVTEDVLSLGLRDRIDLIDGNGFGSVNERIAEEAQDRIDADAAEAQARIDGISAEATARANADAAEITARAAAVAAEAATRSDQIAIESHQRLVQVNQAGEAALNALIAADNERVDRLVDTASARIELNSNLQTGLLAEATARLALTTVVNQNTAAITTEQTARSTADSALASSISTLTTQVGSNTAAISTEATARANADIAEATERNLLATQMRGGYTGNDLSLVTTGLIYQERVARSTQDTALAQQITLLSAGAGEQFDWKQIWYFDDGLESWSGNGTPTVAQGWIRPANQASDAYVFSPTGIDSDGNQYGQVRLRIRKTGTPTFAGYIWWRTSTDTTWDSSRRFALTEPTYDANGIGLITVSPLWTITVDRIRVDLSSAQTVSNYFEIDWVAIGRPSPGASSAQLLEEQEARILADFAEATSRETLSTFLVGQEDPTGLTLPTLTSGLLYDERQARSTADTSIVSSVTSLQTTVTNNFTTLNSAILSEETARTTADTTEANSRKSLSSTLTGFEDPTGKVLADLSSGLVYQESSARVSADSALATSISGLSSSLGDLSADITTIEQTVVDLETSTASSITTLVAADRATENALNGIAEAALRDVISINNERTDRQGTIASAQESINIKINEGLLAEAEERLMLQATVNENTALIVQEQTARATADDALATSLTALIVQTGENAQAAVISEQTARTTADSALATSVTTLTATVDTNTAAINTEATARADADSALSTTITTVSAVANAKNKSYSQASAPTENLVVGDIWFDTDDGNKSYRWDGTAWVITDDTRIAANAAAITTEQTARADADEALAEEIVTLSAVVDENIAAIETESVARATADTALSSQITTISTTVGDNTTSIQTNATSINGIEAKYTVKIDNNGYVSGYGLISTANNGTPTSSFVVSADKFAIASTTSTSPTGNVSSPFFVTTSTQTIDGKTFAPGVYIKKGNISTIDADSITTGFLDANRIDANTITAQKIDSRGLSIKDSAGTVVFSSGTSVGSGNIARNSDFFQETSGIPSYFSIYNNAGISTTSSISTNGALGNAKAWRITANAATSNAFGFFFNAANLFGGWKANTNYIITFYVRSNAMAGAIFQPGWNNAPDSFEWLKNPGLSAGYQRYVARLNFGNNTIDPNGFMRVDSSVPSGAYLEFSAISIEQGDAPSGWSPAPLDSFNKITEANVSTYIESASINTASIKLAAITTGLINDLSVETLKIAGNAVTQPIFSFASGLVYGNGGYQNVASASITGTAGVDTPVIILFSAVVGYSVLNAVTGYRILRNGNVIGDFGLMSSILGMPSFQYFNTVIQGETVTYTVQWYGASSGVAMDFRGLTLLGAKR